jgi:hypothetical protein
MIAHLRVHHGVKAEYNGRKIYEELSALKEQRRLRKRKFYEQQRKDRIVELSQKKKGKIKVEEKELLVQHLV